MGGIWKPAGRKKYRIWYKGHNGRRQTAPGFRDKEASQAKLRDLERDEERRQAGLPVTDRTGTSQSLDLLVNRHIADLARRGASEGYYTSHRGRLVRLAVRAGWTKLGQLTHAALVDALASLCDAAGFADSTVENYRVSWKSFLEWCVDARLCDTNPCGRVKGSKNRQPRRPKRAPSVAEWEELLRVCPSGRRRVYLVAGLTGLRKSELARLERRDVDLENQRLRLRPEANKGRRHDAVPLLPDVVPALTELCEGLGPLDRLFPELPTRTTTTADVKRAGIASPDLTGRHVTFHSLRYFFCTLLARTLPIQVVSLLMRHKDISTTCKTYLDLGLDDVAAEVLRLPPVFARPPAHDTREASDGTLRGLRS